MAWARFVQAFDWTPPADRRLTVSYPAGWAGPVTRDCLARAVAQP